MREGDRGWVDKENEDKGDIYYGVKIEIGMRDDLLGKKGGG